MPRAARKTAPTGAQLQTKVDAVAATSRPPRAAPPPPPTVPVERSTYVDQDTAARPPFGGWLMRQLTGKSEAMDMLIKGAKLDPTFPKGGDPEAVRQHLGKRGADPDVFEAIDDAELSWLAY